MLEPWYSILVFSKYLVSGANEVLNRIDLVLPMVYGSLNTFDISSDPSSCKQMTTSSDKLDGIKALASVWLKKVKKSEISPLSVNSETTFDGRLSSNPNAFKDTSFVTVSS